MRDPARIDHVLAAIRKIWMEHPDFRLGQLLVNSVRLSDPSSDLFTLEDTVLVRKLAVLAKRLRENSGSHPLEDEYTFRMDVGRANSGHTFVRVVHLPTAKERKQIGLNGETAEVVGRRLAEELMNEINGPGDELASQN